MKKTITLALACLTPAMGFVGCGLFEKDENKAHVLGDENETDAANPAWIAKAHRRLLFNRKITPSEMGKYSGKTKGEVVDLLMQEKDFLLTTLDFGSSFLGSAGQLTANNMTVSLNDGTTLQYPIRLQVPTAIDAALEVAKNGDFYKLLNRYATDWSLRVGPPQRDAAALALRFGQETFELSDEEIAGLSDNELRSRLVQVLIDDLLGSLEKLKSADSSELTTEYLSEFCESNFRVFDLPNILGHHSNSGVYDDLTFDAVAKAGFSRNFCFEFEGRPAEEFRQDVIQIYPILVEGIQKFVEVINNAPQIGDNRHFSNVVVHPSEFGAQEENFQADIMTNFFFTNTNSSTNANRARAATIFKTYFCDDMKPIQVILDDGHSGDAHASEPSCQACHYRLDPMAGFFRDYGYLGFNFVNLDANPSFLEMFVRDQTGQEGSLEGLHVFDDNTVLSGSEVAAHKDQWKFANGSWNVGFVRSATDLSKNEYGESLDDLFAIVRNSREVKRCVTQRLVEFYIGTGQSYSEAWIRGLTDVMDTTAADSAKNYKRAVRKIVLSNAFAEDDPVPGICYDGTSGDKNAPPCEIEHVLRENCYQCHSATGALGGLALDTWGELEDGNFTFKHEVGGCQQTKRETLTKIRDAINSQDMSKRMPLQMEMSPGDLEKLNLWVESELSEM